MAYIHRSTIYKEEVTPDTIGLMTDIVGYQVRTADGRIAAGEVDGVRSDGVRIAGMPGHPGRHGYLPTAAIARIDRATDTVLLVPGITPDRILAAPDPPDGPDGWHLSRDWWADLMGHYGLCDPAGRGDAPFLHPGGR